MKKAIFVVLGGLILSACHPLPTASINPQSMIAMTADDDQDGVLNEVDACPTTALNDPVDFKGCTTDNVLSDPIPESRFLFAKNQSFPYWINGYKNTNYENLRSHMQQDFQRMRKFFGRKPNEPICVKIEGHSSTNKYGDSIKNMDLQRALTVKQLYKEWLGFDENNIKIDYYGSERPIANNDTPEHTAMNQRVYTCWIKCPIEK